MPVVSVKSAGELAGRILRGCGVPEASAVVQRDLLIEAELRDLPSHGLLRLERIVQRIVNGVADPRTKGTHNWRSEAFLQVNGERGLGPVVALSAIDAVQRKARLTGIAVAAIANSNHLGMLGWYAERVASAGQTIIALSTSEALVHPWGGRKAMLGTNPIAIGVPVEGRPFVLDTATSIVSMGEIHHHALRGIPLPPDWALDADGNRTTDANAAKAGAIAPFGQAKGYALGLAFELLVSSLAQSAIGRDVRGTLDATEICNKGDVFIVIDGPQAQLAHYLDEIRSSQPAAGFDAVLVPGDRAQRCREERLAKGLPLPDALWDSLNQLADVAHADARVPS